MGADLCFSKPKRITVQLLSKRMTVPCVWNGFNKTTTLSAGPVGQSTIESTGSRQVSPSRVRKKSEATVDDATIESRRSLSRIVIARRPRQTNQSCDADPPKSFFRNLLEMNCADAPPRWFPAPAQLGATLNDSTDMIERLYIQITTKDQ
jgi:hypothetical protein